MYCRLFLAVNNWSEHGLGHLLNPTEPDSVDREWIAQVWLRIVRYAMGNRNAPLDSEKTPAIGRITVSSPVILRPLEGINVGKDYSKQIEPFNFLLSCHVAARASARRRPLTLSFDFALCVQSSRVVSTKMDRSVLKEAIADFLIRPLLKSTNFQRGDIWKCDVRICFPCRIQVYRCPG